MQRQFRLQRPPFQRRPHPRTSNQAQRNRRQQRPPALQLVEATIARPMHRVPSPGHRPVRRGRRRRGPRRGRLPLQHPVEARIARARRRPNPRLRQPYRGRSWLNHGHPARVCISMEDASARRRWCSKRSRRVSTRWASTSTGISVGRPPHGSRRASAVVWLHRWNGELAADLADFAPINQCRSLVDKLLHDLCVLCD